MKLIAKIAVKEFKRLGTDDSGVAMIMTLSVFMFMFLLCSGVYAVGETVREKIELQNAADAASYSAAVIQADTISRVATINRAMAWTYVQMSRRQMDFIVHKWLERSKEIYDEDLKACEKWHLDLSVTIPPGGCRYGHDKKGARADKYWCGIDRTKVGIVRLNGLGGQFGSLLTKLRYSGVSAFGSEVPISHIKAALMLKLGHNVLSAKSGHRIVMPFSLGTQIILDKYNIKVMNMALVDTICSMPGRIAEAVPDILKVNLPESDLDDFNYYLYQSNRPLIEYFRTLKNTKEDERRFISFADYYEKQHISLRDEGNRHLTSFNPLSNLISGGVDRWFVRGDGEKRTDGEYGIQRSYKLWAEEPLKALHPTKNIPLAPPLLLAPSCMNFEEGTDVLPSIGLYSEWQWYSKPWFCRLVITLTGPKWWCNDIPILNKRLCKHCSPGLKVTKEGNCFPAFLPFGEFPDNYGSTRVYGDDPVILEKHREKYIGEKCYPQILTRNFFGKSGSLVVGLSRKSRNPWSRFMKAVGIFSAFEPAVPNMWAVSASRAGYRLANEEKTGSYQLSYLPADNLREEWNLKQADWDAMFLPVKQAWSYCWLNSFLGGGSQIYANVMTDEWKVLKDGSSADTSSWKDVKAPAGMIDSKGESSLNWGKL